MTDYIERVAVHELVKILPTYQMFNYDRTESRIGINPDDVDFGVNKIPAADVVKVVRCRECVSHSEDAATGKLWCTKPMGCIGCLEVKPDDFCSFGERKKAQDE